MGLGSRYVASVSFVDDGLAEVEARKLIIRCVGVA